MKFFFASMIICSLAALADTTPVPDVGSSGVAFMTKTCRSTGMSGGCSASIDSGKGFCLNYAYGFKSAKVYDHFQCQFYSDVDCGGTSKTFKAGTYPNIGMTGKSFRC